MSNMPPDPTTPSGPGIIPEYSMPMRRSSLALWSMILGITAIPTICVFGLGIPLGIAALIMGIIALVSMSKDHYLSGRGFAITGVITGGLSQGNRILLIFDWGSVYGNSDG